MNDPDLFVCCQSGSTVSWLLESGLLLEAGELFTKLDSGNVHDDIHDGHTCAGVGCSLQFVSG